MVIFLESPWPILFIGIAVEAVLAFPLVRTGRGKFSGRHARRGGLGRCRAGRRAVGRHRSESGRADARRRRRGGRKNDLNGLLDCISPSAEEPRDYARWVLGRVEVEEAHISDLEITVNRLTSPPTAEAKFLAVGKGRDRKMSFPTRALRSAWSSSCGWKAADGW